MEALGWKMKISLLWISVAVAMSAHTILLIFDSSATKLIVEWSAVAGNVEWFFSALFWIVPLWMAFVTLSVKGSSNRRSNFFAGLILIT